MIYLIFDDVLANTHKSQDAIKSFTSVPCNCETIPIILLCLIFLVYDIYRSDVTDMIVCTEYKRTIIKQVTYQFWNYVQTIEIVNRNANWTF